MAFIKFTPYVSQNVVDVFTSDRVDDQILQELVSLRHKSKTIYAGKGSASWIDQGKTYYLDARNSDWRSSGLLYYYSFLNFAKAHLATKKLITIKNLKATSVYHGLQSDPQELSDITSFKINIFPPKTKDRTNIFSSFYQSLLQEKWFSTRKVTVSLKDIFPYCKDIGIELRTIYNIDTKNNTPLQSLIRIDKGNNDIWFELECHDSEVINITQQISELPKIVQFSNLNQGDKEDWLMAHGRASQTFLSHKFLRFYHAKYSTAECLKLMEKCDKLFDGIAQSYPSSTSDLNTWEVFPLISLNGNKIKWHPLLSNYLVSFALSSILRYQPHLLQPGDKDSFLAEAWSSQSPITALRYFLFAFTKPLLRFN